MTGRKMGNCNKTTSSQTDTAGTSEAESKPIKDNEVIYGLGRGGKPFGGGGNGFGNRNRNGNGNGFRGGKGRGRGRGRNS